MITQPEAVLLGQRTLAQEAAAEGTSGLQEQLFAVRRSLGKIRARKSRLLDVLLERPQDKDILTVKLGELDREEAQVRLQEKRLLDDRKNAATRDERLAAIREEFKTLRPRLAKLGPEDRRQVCQLMIQEIRIGRDREVQVEWIIPTSENFAEDGEVGHTSSFVLPRRQLSAEQRAAISVRNSEIMRRRVAAGTFVSPTKNPAVAQKISGALLSHVNDGTWKRPPAPKKDPISGRWIKGRVSA